MESIFLYLFLFSSSYFPPPFLSNHRLACLLLKIFYITFSSFWHVLNLVWWLISIFKFMQTGIIQEKNCWAFLWEIILIGLIKIEKPSHCGWQHSLVWHPELYIKEKMTWAINSHSLFLDCRCDQLPEAPTAETFWTMKEKQPFIPHYFCQNILPLQQER